jgi:tellurite resistance protein
MASGAQSLDSEVVVFQMPSVQQLSDCRPEYLSALALADVGAIVAAADGIIHPEERIAFTLALEANATLTAEERQRLNARFELYTRTPPTLRILNRFKDAPNAQREAVAKLAVAIAAADGTIAVEEMRVLERIYKSFALPQERLYADVHAARRDENLAIIAEPETGKSVPIPMAPNRGKPPALNAAKLAKIRADTAVVTSILGDIFEDDAEKSVPASSAGVAHEGQVAAQFDGLDPQHAALLFELMRTRRVDADEFAERAAKHGLLTEGAVEVINDWAFDRFGGPIIEDDDGFRIDRQVFKIREAKVA